MGRQLPTTSRRLNVRLTWIKLQHPRHASFDKESQWNMDRLIFERNIAEKNYRICIRLRSLDATIITYQAARTLNGRDTWQGVPASWDDVRSIMDEAFAGDLAPFRTAQIQNSAAAKVSSTGTNRPAAYSQHVARANPPSPSIDCSIPSNTLSRRPPLQCTNPQCL